MKFWSGFLLGGGELETAGVGEGEQSQGSGLSSCLGWIPVASDPWSDSTRAVVTLDAFICVQGPLRATLSAAVCGLGRDSPGKALSPGRVCWCTECNGSADIWKAGGPALVLVDLLGTKRSAGGWKLWMSNTASQLLLYRRERHAGGFSCRSHTSLPSRHSSRSQSYSQPTRLLLGTNGRTVFPVHVAHGTEPPCNLHSGSLLCITPA